jgi:demethylmenaquinone methyltransferase / 2-methoxy-6-polyprenyl-1,4-benzoquinol methylase
MTIPRRYDTINAVIFVGGSRRLRRQLVASLDVQPRHRVLELGCGSGQVTEQLAATGAEVTAVDALPAMLARAVQRAPSATFIEGDITTVDLAGPFDRVVLSFVLHNFDSVGRRTVLGRSAELLGEDGAVGILDWAVPRSEVPARLWRRFLRWLEPSAAVGEILDGALDVDLVAAGLHARSRRPVAFGRAQILIATTGVSSPRP